jgi:membrane peptidoglycan carboxypeptidase
VAVSRGVFKTITFFKLVLVVVVTGALASGFSLPYVVGVGYGANKATDKFLDTSCDINTLNTVTPQASHMYASDGTTLIATFFGQFNRTDVTLSQIPLVTQQALIDTEDRRFYQHHGVDTRGLARAILHESDGSTQGASTLTEQYVKQVRYYQATTPAEQQAAISETADRKLYEAKCALALEKKYSKATILNNYFNIANFGEHSYGIAAAARTYFNEAPSQLNVAQSATITGIVKDPSLYDPIQNPVASKQRRNEVIANMQTAGHLSPAAAAMWEAKPLGLSTGASQPSQGCANADLNKTVIANVGFFCDYAVAWLTRPKAQGGGGLTADAINSGGYKIVTSLDVTKQNSMQANLWSQYDYKQTPQTAVIMPVIDPRSGEVEAMVTSKQYQYANNPAGPNRTVEPIFTLPVSGSGSTYKYFSLVAALTAGVPDTQRIYSAQPYTAASCNNQPPYVVNNAGNDPSDATLRQATVDSINTYFVAVEDQLFGCQLQPIVDAARNLGMDSLNTPDRQEPSKTYAQATVSENQASFTLGQVPTSPLELTTAYGVSANDGVLAPPKPVLSVTVAASGTPVAYAKPVAKRVLSPFVARTVISIMTGDTLYGGGTAGSYFGQYYNALAPLTHTVASKTGTNNATNAQGQDSGGNSGLWFVGMTPSMVAATALYDLGSPNTEISLPNLGNGTGDTFGAFGAKYWIGALQPYLAKTSWTWPTTATITNAVAIPNVITDDEANARTAIQAAGFIPANFGTTCGSSVQQSYVAYAGPAMAVPGSTVYYCLSSGNPLKSPPPPPKKPTTPPTKTPPKKPKKTH